MRGGEEIDGAFACVGSWVGGREVCAVDVACERVLPPAACFRLISASSFLITSISSSITFFRDAPRARSLSSLRNSINDSHAAFIVGRVPAERSVDEGKV